MLAALCASLHLPGFWLSPAPTAPTPLPEACEAFLRRAAHHRALVAYVGFGSVAGYGVSCPVQAALAAARRLGLWVVLQSSSLPEAAGGGACSEHEAPEAEVLAEGGPRKRQRHWEAARAESGTRDAMFCVRA